jgi:hypothetical protein
MPGSQTTQGGSSAASVADPLGPRPEINCPCNDISTTKFVLRSLGLRSLAAEILCFICIAVPGVGRQLRVRT